MSFRSLMIRGFVAALSLIVGSQALAARTTTFFHNDGLGSVVAATNEAGAVLWRKDYAPFGEQIDSQPETERTSYTGKQHDDEIGLTYFGGRYFDPEIGRFISVDPVGFVEDNTMSFNRYLYVNNNPYKYVDPDGKFLNFAVKFIADVAMGVAINYLTSGSLGIGAALKDSAMGVLNPAKTLVKAKKLVGLLAKVEKKMPVPLARSDRGLMGACFAAGTPIQTERGILPIEEVRVDDRIWSRNEATGEEDYRRVIQTFVTPEQPTLALRVAGDGGATETIETTEEHPFWAIGRGWTAARELQSGDAIFSSRESSARVVSTSRTNRTTSVYNFEVEEFHTYFVGNAGLWVHNVSRFNMQPAGGVGRTGRQERLREIADDPKASSADRGWIRNEQRQVAQGNRDTIRNPPGKDLAHERGREAAKGYSYEHSNLQDRDLHKLQHKHDDFGRANAERPPE